MSTDMDAYGGADAWDRYCDEMDERAKRVKWGAACGECLHCRTPNEHQLIPGEDFPDDIGWCTENEFFVRPSWHPGDYDCDNFDY